MATMEKRGDVQWRVKVRNRGYQEQSKSFTTKAAACRWARKMDDGPFVSRCESESATLKMLSNRYKEEITPKKKSADVEVYRIDALIKHKMAGELNHSMQHNTPSEEIIVLRYRRYSDQEKSLMRERRRQGDGHPESPSDRIFVLVLTVQDLSN